MKVPAQKWRLLFWTTSRERNWGRRGVAVFMKSSFGKEGLRTWLQRPLLSDKTSSPTCCTELTSTCSFWFENHPEEPLLVLTLVFSEWARPQEITRHCLDRAMPLKLHCTTHLRVLWKHCSDSMSLRWDPRFHISNKLSGDADDVGPTTTR